MPQEPFILIAIFKHNCYSYIFYWLNKKVIQVIRTLITMFHELDLDKTVSTNQASSTTYLLTYKLQFCFL